MKICPRILSYTPGRGLLDADWLLEIICFNYRRCCGQKEYHRYQYVATGARFGAPVCEVLLCAVDL